MHLMNRVAMDVDEGAQRAHRVDLGEGIQETVLLIRSENAVILADAEVFVVIVVGLLDLVHLGVPSFHGSS